VWQFLGLVIGNSLGFGPLAGLLLIVLVVSDALRGIAADSERMTIQAEALLLAVGCLVSFLSIRQVWQEHRVAQRAQPYPPDWDDLRRKVYARENYRCQNCGQGGREMHAHHIVPLANGGSNELGNLACLCRDCHESIHPHMRTVLRGAARSRITHQTEMKRPGKMLAPIPGATDRRRKDSAALDLDDDDIPF
jgi:hypothetical protein